MGFPIYLVEDNKIYGNLLKGHLSRYTNSDVHLFFSAKNFISKLDSTPKIICLDFYLPDMNGLEVLKLIKEKSPNSYVIMVSSQTELEIVALLIKNGAYDYVVKGADTRQKLQIIINNILQVEKLKNENNDLRNLIKSRYNIKQLIKGSSPQIAEVFNLMTKAADINLPVLITGETGTGKELVAKGIHFNSEKKDKPFIPINISSVPPTLIESELFGHEKGSFTGADQRKIGKFELANGGTLFIDEIGDLDISLQTKFLRAIQEKEINRVGGNETIKLDVRIISATHRDLESLINEDMFREDLYFRIRGLPIFIPPLRNRGKDKILLANHFIQEYCEFNNLKLKKLDTKAQKRILSYSYPGNVRELKAAVELACVLADSDIIAVDDMKLSGNISSKKYLRSEKTMKEYNHEILVHYLEKYNNNIKKVGEILGISRPTLYRMIKDIKTLEE